MKTNQTLATNTNKRISIILVIAALLLALPFFAMQFTKEVVWTGSDFIIAGIILFGTGILLEMILRRFKTLQSRLILVGMLLIIILLLWTELAVGLFGSPFAGS